MENVQIYSVQIFVNILNWQENLSCAMCYNNNKICFVNARNTATITSFLLMDYKQHIAIGKMISTVFMQHIFWTIKALII